VACGAILRAFNKERGPRRYARTSYGILRTEPYGDFPEHRVATKTWDKLDGQYYVRNTIDWVLKLVMARLAFLVFSFLVSTPLTPLASQTKRARKSNQSGCASRSSAVLPSNAFQIRHSSAKTSCSPRTYPPNHTTNGATPTIKAQRGSAKSS
jgi:hypothetical protein